MKIQLNLLITFFILVGLKDTTAQNNQLQNNQHKIIFQLVTADTMAHKALMKQLNNILSVSPNTQMEVVCHGPGLEMLTSNKSIVASKIHALNDRGVKFFACEFSMKERNIDKSQIIPDAGFVQAGIVYIVQRQEEGWSYIKAGF
jgi:hypothetical protein